MKLLAVFVLSLSWSLSSWAQYKLQVNGQAQPAKLTFTIQDKKPVAVLMTRMSVSAKSAVMYANGEEADVKFKDRGGQTVFYLPGGNGELKVTTASGEEETFTISSNTSIGGLRLTRAVVSQDLKLDTKRKRRHLTLAEFIVKVSRKRKRLLSIFLHPWTLNGLVQTFSRKVVKALGGKPLI